MLIGFSDEYQIEHVGCGKRMTRRNYRKDIVYN
jgi:hypothetical protein